MLKYEKNIKSVYNFGKKLGAGQFGQVILVEKKSTNERYAMKIIPKAECRSKLSRNLLVSEMMVLQRTDHKNLMSVCEQLEDDKNFYFFCELMPGGELNDRILKTTMSEKDASYVVKQLLDGLHFMHKQGIMHRDMKPQNCLMTSKTSLEVKISDFGMSDYFNFKVGRE